MKKISIMIIISILSLFLFGCTKTQPVQVVATTKPVYDFSAYLCQNTNIQVELLVTENLSCLHDYTLQVRQMRAIESAQVIVMNGAGLEEFLHDAIHEKQNIIDASQGIHLICDTHEHAHDENNHKHSQDPHIWLNVSNARLMAENICNGLILQFPECKEQILKNMHLLNVKFDELDAYGKNALSNLSTNELITFHDGFSYFAEYWDLHILHALEEESGSEASAAELIELIQLVKSNNLPAIFVEENGSTSASGIIATETGVNIYSLNMGMSQKDYFESMYQNIDNIKEALG